MHMVSVRPSDACIKKIRPSRSVHGYHYKIAMALKGFAFRQKPSGLWTCASKAQIPSA